MFDPHSLKVRVFGNRAMIGRLGDFHLATALPPTLLVTCSMSIDDIASNTVSCGWTHDTSDHPATIAASLTE